MGWLWEGTRGIVTIKPWLFDKKQSWPLSSIWFSKFTKDSFWYSDSALLFDCNCVILTCIVCIQVHMNQDFIFFATGAYYAFNLLVRENFSQLLLEILSVQAATFGGSNIDPTAWEDKKCKGESRFPAQVKHWYNICISIRLLFGGR